MSFPRYPKYKDSGVEWLGEVPEHWRVNRLKRVCDVYPSNIDKKSYEGEESVFLCNYTDVYYNDQIVQDMDFMVATASCDQIIKFTLRSGDTIITKDSETADDIAIAAYIPKNLPGVVCGYHLSVVRPRADVFGAYVKRFFDSHYVRAKFRVSANGLTRVGLSQYAVDNIILPWPPNEEQSIIAAFLDRETTKIDALVAEQEKLIALLKEKRQAVISHAVTKGLDPTVPMKDSGVEWLGEVPEGWEIKPVRRVLSAPLSNGIFKKKEEFGEGALLINVFDIYRPDFKVDFDSLDRVKCNPGEIVNYEVLADDLLFVRSSLKQEGIAVVAIAGNCSEPVVYECHLIRARPNRQVLNGHFGSYVLNSVVYRSKMVAKAKITTMTTIDQEAILSTKLPLPPISEQSAIAAFLDRETARIDILTTEAERGIVLLKERRSALI
ncbi:MAG: restriction endonuclease subunit S, partial [Ferrovum sp.]|nr:restriction endonuclease subunit S [Ferrovum sp.]